MNPAIKNRFTEKVIIPAGKYVSIKGAVENNKANLSGADLSGADLYLADLSGANLYEADLSRADLSFANLSFANLSDADLSFANLSDADLSRAKIFGGIITKPPIQIHGIRWDIIITEKKIAIGCQVHNGDEWFKFSDKAISEMHEDALKWWKKHKEMINQAWEAHKK